MGNFLNIINSDKHFYDSNEFSNHNYMKCLEGAFYSSELKNHFEGRVKLFDIDNLDDTLKYIYLIECRTQDGIYSGFFRIPQKVLDLVNQDRCKVIFSYEAEGDFNVNYFNGWYYLTCKGREEEIKFSNFYIFHCELNCEKNNETPVNFFVSTHHFDNLSFEVNKIASNNGHRELDKFDYDFHLKNIKDIDIDSKSKHFLCYLRNCGRDHRRALACYFQHHKLWENNNISFLKFSYTPKLESKIPTSVLPKKYWNNYEETVNLPIVEIDTQNIDNKDGFDTSFSGNWKHYQETYLSVVSETMYSPENITPFECNFFSEKICKPLINLHPFILMSTPYSLQKLRKFGFKTFDGFIDESYDKEKDHLKRTEMIFDELDKFRNKSDKELKDWWKEILPILEHNQKTFMSMGNRKTNKIKLLENIYD
mgnify:CR=1 FL=1|tara:strand:- start:355 stop:1623 length:1269 start_codon:yes stop_codon:yes gene_type:complete